MGPIPQSPIPTRIFSSGQFTHEKWSPRLVSCLSYSFLQFYKKKMSIFDVALLANGSEVWIDKLTEFNISSSGLAVTWYTCCNTSGPLLERSQYKVSPAFFLCGANPWLVSFQSNLLADKSPFGNNINVVCETSVSCWDKTNWEML